MQHDPFSRLPASALHSIEMRVGDVLFRQGQPTAGLYRVRSGAVVLQRSSASGDAMTLHRAVGGQHFAEASVFSDVYHCDAICTGDGVVQRIAKQDIRALLRHDPDFAEEFARTLAVQLQNHRHLFEIIGIRSAKARVHAAIEAGYLQNTVQEFATRIHLTQEASYRALGALCDDGVLIRTGRGRYALVTR